MMKRKKKFSTVVATENATRYSKKKSNFTNSIIAPSGLEKFSAPMSIAVLAEAVNGIFISSYNFIN